MAPERSALGYAWRGVFLFAVMSCGREASQAVDARPSDAGPSDAADATAAHLPAEGDSCTTDSECGESLRCAFSVEAGCEATKQCLRDEGIPRLQCGCAGRDVMATTISTEAIAHDGSCKGAEVNCDFAFHRDTLSSSDNDDCLKKPCPPGYICDIGPTLVADTFYATVCYRAPARCGDKPTCDCITPCACSLARCSDHNTGVQCNSLPDAGRR